MTRPVQSLVQENVPLAPRTTLGVGGPARRFLTVGDEAALQEALARADGEGWPVFLLGGGSNLVVADSGWPGLVLQLAPAGWRATEAAGRVEVCASAGEAWDGLVRCCAEAGWAGVECLAGIPGTVGATPVQNVGAYGQEVAETITGVRALDRRSGAIHALSASDCLFAYRESRFNAHEPGRWILLSVTFALRPGGAPTLRYADLRQRFREGAAPSLTEVADAVREIRGSKGMVIDPADAESRSAGSFFKNPVVPAEVYAQFRQVHPEAPGWPQADGRVKLPAAWLIERAGLARGQALAGGVRLSRKHVLALVNRGDATAADLASSARRIQRLVQERWGIALTPEPLFVGEWSSAALPAGASVVSG